MTIRIELVKEFPPFDDEIDKEPWTKIIFADNDSGLRYSLFYDEPQGANGQLFTQGKNSLTIEQAGLVTYCAEIFAELKSHPEQLEHIKSVAFNDDWMMVRNPAPAAL